VKEQVSGVRCRVTGARGWGLGAGAGAGAMLNSELSITDCAPPSYFWPPPTAFCFLPTAVAGGRWGKNRIRDSGFGNQEVKEQPACSAGPAVRPCGSSSDAGSCRAANRTIRFRFGRAPNTVSENIQAAPSKPRRGGKAAPINRGATIHPMSRLRRLLISGKIFFATCNLLRTFSCPILAAPSRAC
jgi:hypothetical protein